MITRWRVLKDEQDPGADGQAGHAYWCMRTSFAAEREVDHS